MDRIKLFLVWAIVVFTSAGAFAAPYSIPKDGARRMWNEGANSWCSYINPLFNYFDATGGVLPEYPVVLGPLSVSGAGNSWLELGNNTSFTDVLTGKGGYGLLNWLPYAILNGEQKRLALFEELGSFAFDTFPTYEDSTHSSGIAVNGTTLAVYSETASKWLTVALTDSLEPEPVLYTLTVTDPGNADVISSTDTFIDCGDGATDCTHDYVAASTPELTYTTAAGRTFTAWTGDATDTSTSTNPDTITMDASKSVSGASTVTSAYTTSFSDDFNRTDNANVTTGSSWTSETDTGGIGSILNNTYSISHSGSGETRISKTIAANNTDYEVKFKVKLSDITAVDTQGVAKLSSPIQLYCAVGVFAQIYFRTSTGGDVTQFSVSRYNDAGSVQASVYTNFAFVADEYIEITIQADVGEAGTSDGVIKITANETTLLDLTGVADETRPIVSEIRCGLPVRDWNQPNTITIDDFQYGYK